MVAEVGGLTFYVSCRIAWAAKNLLVLRWPERVLVVEILVTVGDGGDFFLDLTTRFLIFRIFIQFTTNDQKTYKFRLKIDQVD